MKIYNKMKINRFMVLITIFTIVLAKESYLKDRDVHILTASKAKSFINENGLAFVYAYVNKCKLCEEVNGFLHDLTDRLQQLDERIKIGKIDASLHSDIQKTINSMYFPFLGFFINGIVIKYDGEIDMEKIVSWVSSFVLEEAPIGIIETKEEMEEFKRKSFALGIKYDDTDKEAYKISKGLRKVYKDFNQYRIVGEAADELLDEFLLYIPRDFDDGHKTIGANKAMPASVIQQFIEMFRFPNVRQFNEQITKEIFRHKRTGIILFDKAYDTQAGENLRSLAFRYKEWATIAMSKYDEVNYSAVSELFGLKETDPATLIIMDFKGGKIRKFLSLDVSTQGMIDFIESYLKNETVEFSRGEPIPKYNESVRKLVRDNYEEIVHDNNNHVLVAFYTDWCTHCKDIHPLLDEIKKRLENDEKDIVIAKINVSRNDINYTVPRYPYIALFKKDNKQEPEIFTGMRDWGVILEWLEESTGKPKLFVRSMHNQRENVGEL